MFDFLERLHLKLPVIQAPMAGIVTPALVAAVGNAGCLGSLPLGYLTIDEARQAIRKTAAVSAFPFSVNVFVPETSYVMTKNQINRMLTHINACRKSLDLADLHEIPVLQEPNFNELIEMIIAEGIGVLSFTFGILQPEIIDKLHQNDVFIIGTATSVKEGIALQSAGCDAIVAQGYEAGGHRGGGFLQSPGGLIGGMALVPQLVDALSIPVIAAGGIMDGRGIISALALGASAAQLGTAFLTCDESGASALHKQMILHGSEESTCITSVFTGKPARGFKNKFVEMTESQFKDAEILPYPLQHQATKELRARANQSNQSDYTSLWSGQGVRLGRTLSVADLIQGLEKEMSHTVARLSSGAIVK